MTKQQYLSRVMRSLYDVRGPTCEHAIERQQNHGTQDRHKHACGLTLRVQTHRAAKEAAEERASDTEAHRYDESARVTTGHHQLGNDACDETEEYPAKNTEHHVLLAEAFTPREDPVQVFDQVAAVVVAAATR
jgi:hypothetical protein